MGQNITIVMKSNKFNNIGMPPIKEKFCPLNFFFQAPKEQKNENGYMSLLRNNSY